MIRTAFRMSLAVRILHSDEDRDMNRYMYVHILSDKRSLISSWVDIFKVVACPGDHFGAPRDEKWSSGFEDEPDLLDNGPRNH